MKREIKFREWIGIEMEYNPPISMISSASINERFVDTVIMQFTGLKDKNGKEIYEGDILRIGNYTMYGGIYFVEWNNEINAFVFKRNLVSPTLLCNAKEIEVIGNIYENIDLLNN